MIPLPFLNQVIEGDCLQIMHGWPPNCIDMVLCDPPFGFTQNTWDQCIDLTYLWQILARIVKPSGAILLFGQGSFTAELILSNREQFRYKIVWIKSKATNFLNRLKQPLRKHEDICVFYKEQATFNPQMGRGKSYQVHRKGFKKETYGDFNSHTSSSDGQRYPTDVILYESYDFIYSRTCEHTNDGFYHPTQKPVELGSSLVRTYSNPGDTILDFACGSGSFLVAAAIENRQFIGIELNKNITKNGLPVDLIEVCRQRLKIFKQRSYSEFLWTPFH
ncbi:site-specific DNA-methyltransferase [Chitinophaga pollutisoli]|uniref:site-specific DNA-methyltransferase (adenine-specific) n=1 Tax=Chitinophaga pollutisoli TaxID=3133966 RepID=A0ABZ2YSN1_9BACT